MSSDSTAPATPPVADVIEVIVDGFAHGGEGVGRIDGKVVLVATRG